MKVGDKVRIVSDNEYYDSFRGVALAITDAEVGGVGYDFGVFPQKLMCFTTEEGIDVPFSLYEYEVELI